MPIIPGQTRRYCPDTSTKNLSYHTALFDTLSIIAAAYRRPAAQPDQAAALIGMTLENCKTLYLTLDQHAFYNGARYSTVIHHTSRREGNYETSVGL